jgi:hypothetical protein
MQHFASEDVIGEERNIMPCVCLPLQLCQTMGQYIGNKDKGFECNYIGPSCVPNAACIADRKRFLANPEGIASTSALFLRQVQL